MKILKLVGAGAICAAIAVSATLAQASGESSDRPLVAGTRTVQETGTPIVTDLGTVCTNGTDHVTLCGQTSEQ